MPITGSTIKQLRTAKKLTQEELAVALSVTRQTVNALEQGRYEPSISLAFKCARYFKTSIEAIFKYEN